MKIKLAAALLAAWVAGTWGCGGGQSTLKRDPIYKSAQKEERVRQIQERLQASPNDLESRMEDLEYRMELGRIYLDEGMVDEAIRSYETVVYLDPKNLSARMVLAIAYQRRDRPNLVRAAQLLEEARQMAPQRADIHLNLGQVYQAMNKPDQAIREFHQAMQLTKEPEPVIAALLGLTALYQSQGDQKQAHEALETARRIYPGIDEVIKERQILKKTPPPVYAGGDVTGRDGTHPHHEERAKRAKEKIQKLKEKEVSP
jgi:tetratricopeptide (TPR) repeat protein